MDPELTAFVVDKVLNDGFNHPDTVATLITTDAVAAEVVEQLAIVCSILHVDASQTRDLDVVAYDHGLEVAEKGKRTKLQSVLDEKLRQLESETSKATAAWNQAVIHKKEEVNYKSGNEKVEYYQKKVKEYQEEIKLKERMLTKVGFTDKLSNEALKTFENKNQEKRVEIKTIKDNVLSFNGIEPKNDSLKQKIKQLKDELALGGDVYNMQ